MIARSLIAQLVEQENLNFLLTNRIPRRLATRFTGRFSRIEQPLVRDLSTAVWRLFSDLDLSEAWKTRFTSMHDCFTRELRDGGRTVDPDPAVLASPCDTIIGASGVIAGDELLQIKGLSYTLRELFGECDLVPIYRGTRPRALTSGMYHRFYAPHDCRVESVTHIPGDTFNVNPVALKRIDRLFRKNERAVLRSRLTTCPDAGRGHKGVTDGAERGRPPCRIIPMTIFRSRSGGICRRMRRTSIEKPSTMPSRLISATRGRRRRRIGSPGPQ